jgi:8-oxo-dGTP pyrophosphatase MutT (NUDIX family)
LKAEEIINKANENIKKGVAIATGIGVFAAISDKKRILLRRRAEKESFIYSKDLSGKWELPGGGMELRDFGEEYQSSFKNTLQREIKEETGLEILESPEIVLLPAVLKRSSIEKLSLIDFAFVIPVPHALGSETNEYREKLTKGEIQWISLEDIEKIQIVSERMKYLIAIAIDYMKQHW